MNIMGAAEWISYLRAASLFLLKTLFYYAGRWYNRQVVLCKAVMYDRLFQKLGTEYER